MAEDLGSNADLVWTFPGSSAQTGRYLGIELFRGETERYPVSGRGRPLKIRGFQAEVATVEDGYGLSWREGEGPCERFTLNAYDVTERELIRFASGLRRS